MAHDETIRIYRSSVPGAEPPSLTYGELAANLADRKLFVGGTGGTANMLVLLENPNTGVTGISAGHTGIAVNGTTGFVQVFNMGVLSLDGQTGHLSRGATGNTVLAGSGIAIPTSNDNTKTIINVGVTGILQDDRTLTGAVRFNNGKGITFSYGTGGLTFANTGVLTINSSPPDDNGNFNIAAPTVVTGDSGALYGDGVRIGARLATESLTGVASFPTTDFGVVNGEVSLTGNVARTNAGQTFTAFQNFTAGLSGNLTGSATSLGGTAANSWALQSWVTSGLSGKANTDGSNASGTWNIDIDGNASTATTANKVQNSLSFGFGLTSSGSYDGSSARTVEVSYRPPLATTGASGVASFLAQDFSVSNTGHVSLSKNFIEIYGSDGIGVSGNEKVELGQAITVRNTGVTSFNGITGSINLLDFVVGEWISTRSQNAKVVFTNIGVTSFNGSTGTVTYAPALATTGASGVASFSSDNFRVTSTGQVFVKNSGISNENLVNSSIRIDTVTGSGLAGGLSASLGQSISLTNIGVTGILVDSSTLTGSIRFNSGKGITFSYGANGLTFVNTGILTINSLTADANGNFNIAAATVVTGDGGALFGDGVRINARLATESLTGVANFPPSDFAVVDGSVSLTGNVARTNIQQVFNAFQNFTAGLSGNITGNATTATTAANANALGGTNANQWALQSWVTSGLNDKANTSGSNATGTWPINITGNSATATQVSNALTIGSGLAGNISTYNGSAAVTITNVGITSINGLTGAVAVTGTANEIEVGVLGSNVVVGLPNNVAIDNLIVTQDITASHFIGTLIGRVTTPVKNTESYTLTAGTPVYISGYVGGGASGIIEVKAAFANNSSTMPAVGLLETTLLPNDQGQVVEIGVLGELNTSGFVSGQTVFISPLGGLTATRPTSGDHLVQNIGRVVNSSSNQGEIIVLGPGRSNDVPNNIIVRGFLQMPNGQTATSIVTTFNGMTGAVDFGWANLLQDAGGQPGEGVPGDVITWLNENSEEQVDAGWYSKSIYDVYRPYRARYTGAVGTGFFVPQPDLGMGMASFTASHFVVDNGAVSLSGAYGIIGVTGISAGFGIFVSGTTGNVVIGNLGVTSFNGLTGTVTLTGDSGSIIGVSNNTITARLATTGATGVASFPSTDFGVSTLGVVSLTGNVARTNAEQAFTAFQNFTAGLSGNLTGSATSLGGTAANSWALLSSIGNGVLTLNVSGVGLTSGTQTFSANQSGAGTFTVTSNATGNNIANTIVARDALGNFSAGTINATLSGNAATSTTANQVANSLTIGVGLGGGSYNGSAGITITNLGVTSIAISNSDAGATGKVVITGGTNVSVSRDGNVITISSSDGATGNTVVAGTGIHIPETTGSVRTINNTGVLSLNGLTGARTLTGDGAAVIGVDNSSITARLATTGSTGVASFSSSDFVVVGGAVSLTGNVARTNSTNTFTAFQNFTAGLSGNLTGSATSLGGTAANSWALQSWVTSGLDGKANTTGNNASGTWPINITGNAATATQVSGTLTIGTGLAGSSFNGSSNVTIANIGVTSFNGITGAVTLTGDGAAVVGIGNNTITARLATTGATGVASFSSSDFTLVSGAVSLTGNVARTNISNTFNAFQFFPQGFNTAKGITFASTTEPVNMRQNLNVEGNISAANFLSWETVNTDKTLSPYKGVFANKSPGSGQLVLTIGLGSQIGIGTMIEISGITGSWRIKIPLNHTVHFGNVSIAGTALQDGYLDSTHHRDAIRLACCTLAGSTTQWNVLSSIGSIDYGYADIGGIG